jgi:hypothetical protein
VHMANTIATTQVASRQLQLGALNSFQVNISEISNEQCNFVTGSSPGTLFLPLSLLTSPISIYLCSVSQLIEALGYRLEDRGFVSR